MAHLATCSTRYIVLCLALLNILLLGMSSLCKCGLLRRMRCKLPSSDVMYLEGIFIIAHIGNVEPVTEANHARLNCLVLLHQARALARVAKAKWLQKYLPEYQDIYWKRHPSTVCLKQRRTQSFCGIPSLILHNYLHCSSAGLVECVDPNGVRVIMVEECVL